MGSQGFLLHFGIVNFGWKFESMMLICWLVLWAFYRSFNSKLPTERVSISTISQILYMCLLKKNQMFVRTCSYHICRSMSSKMTYVIYSKVNTWSVILASLPFYVFKNDVIFHCFCDGFHFLGSMMKSLPLLFFLGQVNRAV